MLKPQCHDLNLFVLLRDGHVVHVVTRTVVSAAPTIHVRGLRHSVLIGFHKFRRCSALFTFIQIKYEKTPEIA